MSSPSALFDADRRALAGRLREVRAFLADRLALSLKERATVLAPAEQGLPFLGWRVYRGMLRLRPSNLRRLRWRLRHRAWEARHGRIGPEELVASMRSVAEHLRQGSTLHLRRRIFENAGGEDPSRAPPASGGRGSPARATA